MAHHSQGGDNRDRDRGGGGRDRDSDDRGHDPDRDRARTDRGRNHVGDRPPPRKIVVIDDDDFDDIEVDEAPPPRPKPQPSQSHKQDGAKGPLNGRKMPGPNKILSGQNIGMAVMLIGGIAGGFWLSNNWQRVVPSQLAGLIPGPAGIPRGMAPREMPYWGEPSRGGAIPGFGGPGFGGPGGPRGREADFGDREDRFPDRGARGGGGGATVCEEVRTHRRVPDYLCDEQEARGRGRGGR